MSTDWARLSDSLKVEVIDGQKYIRCSSCKTPKRVIEDMDGIAIRKKRHRISELERRLEQARKSYELDCLDGNGNRYENEDRDKAEEIEVLQDELGLSKTELILTMVPLYSSPEDFTKFVCGQCFEGLYTKADRKRDRDFIASLEKK